MYVWTSLNLSWSRGASLYRLYSRILAGISCLGGDMLFILYTIHTTRESVQKNEFYNCRPLVIQTCAGTSAQLLHANSRVIMQSYNANSRVIMYWSDQDTRRELEKYTTKQPYRGLTQNTKRLCIDTTIFYTCAHAQLVERLPRKQSVYQSRIPPRADLLFSLERKSCPGCSWLVCYALPFYLIDTRFIHAQ